MFRINRKETIFLIFFASVIVFLYAIFHLVIIKKLSISSSPYYWVTPIVQEDYIFHIWPGIREVFDGYFPRGDVDLIEYKNLFYTLQPQFTPLFFYPFLLLLKSFQLIWVAEPIFYAIIFLLLYYLFNLLINNKKVAIFFSFLYTTIRMLPYFLLPQSYDGLKTIIKLFLPVTLPGNRPLLMSESLMESHLPGALILLLFYIFFLLFLKTEKRKFIFLAGIFYGLLFYTYTFYWINTTFALGIFVIFNLPLKQILFFLKEKEASYFNAEKRSFIYKLIKILLIGLLVGVPYWLNYLNLKNLSHFTDITQRLAGHETFGRHFDLSFWPLYIWYGVLIFLLFRWGKEEGKIHYAKFFISAIIANFISFNLQTILGFNLPASHWQFRTITTILASTQVVLLFWFLQKLIEKTPWLKKIFFVTAIVIVLLVTSGAISAQINKADKSYYQHFSQIDPNIMLGLDWLNKNTPKDAVIMSPSFYMNNLIAVYTDKNIFIPRGLNTLASNAEIKQRVYLTYKLYGFGQQTFEQIFTPNPKTKLLLEQARINELVYKKNKEEIESPEALEMDREFYLFALFYHQQNPDGFEKFMPDDERKRFFNEYTNFRLNLRRPDSLYRFDYLLYGPNEKYFIHQDFSKYKFLTKIYSQNGFEIYKIIN